jgi:hypothetical protein
MNRRPVTIVTEGVLDEVVLRHILRQKTDLEPVLSLTGQGRSYIEAKLRGLNRAARGSTFVVLVDLDDARECPGGLIDRWLDGEPRAETLVVRFAVLTVESWLMADWAGLCAELRVRPDRTPPGPVDRPKRALIDLARTSSSPAIREGMVPRPRSTAQVGPGRPGVRHTAHPVRDGALEPRHGGRRQRQSVTRCHPAARPVRRAATTSLGPRRSSTAVEKRRRRGVVSAVRAARASSVPAAHQKKREPCASITIVMPT